MLVSGQAQLTGIGAFYGGGFNYGGSANALLGGGYQRNNACGFGHRGGWGGQSFGQMAGWGAAWKADIYNMQTGQAWDTQLQSTLGRRDPVYLDTNRDGKLNVEGGKNVSFDINGDGIADRLHEWNTQDAQLVYDANNNGKIDNGREIMNETSISGQQNAYKNGWEKAQALFDTNKDGMIDDAELDKAKFWTDANGDGKTDEGELKTAKEMNIISIDTKNGKFVTKEKVGEMNGFLGGFSGGWGRSSWGGGRGCGGNRGFGGFAGGFAGAYARFF